MKKQLTSLCILFILLFSHLSNTNQSIAILGTGYVGLVLGTGLAECGNIVTCCDIDTEKIAKLQQGHIPIYEPGLSELVTKNVAQGRLFFTTSIDKAIDESQVVFIAVGTPTNHDGTSNLQYIFSAVDMIIQNSTSKKIICVKSTLPIGTCEKIKELIAEKKKENLLTVVSNPEFLREGSAVNDFFNPDRIIIGSESQESALTVKGLFGHIITESVPVIITDTTTAETIKYAANSFLATKISFINEIAHLCELTGADISMVEQGIGTDPRIGKHFLKPGPGFGGSCFPKDTYALTTLAKQLGVDLNTVMAAIRTNSQQKTKAVRIAKEMLGTLEGATIGIWGLSFKANTDDVRESAAVDIIDLLINHHCLIQVYDPMGMDNMKKIYPSITYCKNELEACNQADALIILTEWDEFKTIDSSEIFSVMRTKNIIDMRNLLNYKKCKSPNSCIFTVGRGFQRHA